MMIACDKQILDAFCCSKPEAQTNKEHLQQGCGAEEKDIKKQRGFGNVWLTHCIYRICTCHTFSYHILIILLESFFCKPLFTLFSAATLSIHSLFLVLLSLVLFVVLTDCAILATCGSERGINHKLRLFVILFLSNFITISKFFKCF